MLQRPKKCSTSQSFPLFRAVFLSLSVVLIFAVTNSRRCSTDSVSLFLRHSRIALQNFWTRDEIEIRLSKLPEDDDSLFRLASRVSPNPPAESTRKIAFMFLTTSPLPFSPLWEEFFKGVPENLYNVYVHADPSQNYDPPFSGVFSGRVVHSKPSQRHTPTLVAAARRLLANSLLHDESNYMFALLSPSCIPIRSFDFIYKTLISSPKSFIEILKDEPGQFDRWAARGLDAMLPEVALEDFRIGSQFWVLNRKHARLVARDHTLWEKFNKTCVSLENCYPDENYFPTLVRMEDPGGCVPATLTHVDWSVSFGGHPRMYETEEVKPSLIRRLRNARPRYGEDGTNESDWSVTDRNDPFLFARKFSPLAVRRLLLMARSVIFNDRFGA